MYYLHLHEGKQAFCIIPSGVTITEAHDGVSVLNSSSTVVLKIYATALILFAKKNELVLTVDDLLEMKEGKVFGETLELIKIKHD